MLLLTFRWTRWRYKFVIITCMLVNVKVSTKKFPRFKDRIAVPYAEMLIKRLWLHLTILTATSEANSNVVSNCHLKLNVLLFFFLFLNCLVPRSLSCKLTDKELWEGERGRDSLLFGLSPSHVHRVSNRKYFKPIRIEGNQEPEQIAVDFIHFLAIGADWMLLLRDLISSLNICVLCVELLKLIGRCNNIGFRGNGRHVFVRSQIFHCS